MLLTTKVSETMPNGSPCVIKRFEVVPKDAARKTILGRCSQALRQIYQRPSAWSPVTFVGPAPGVPEGGYHQTIHASVDDVITTTVNRFLDQITMTGDFENHVFLPACQVRTPADVVSDTVVYPAPELVFDRSNNLVACRVTFPLVPSAARVASSMLSSTIELGQARCVAHSMSSADTTLDPNAHNAALYVASTRVRDMADLAITHDTVLHPNMFKPRQPLRNVVREMRVYGGYVRVYHCRSL